ncbi:MAG: ATP-dependent sacrificial sulfur transferase LarE [Deltaproteobacteria bacterium]|nr:ATP-dependent sacrificial sulfur transferase LarE [Deltaproteobacteria bacterium]
MLKGVQEVIHGGFVFDADISASAHEKQTKLIVLIRSMRSVLAAFSGGVDSTFLLKTVVDVLGAKAGAITATSPTYPEHEFEAAKRLAVQIGARHIIVESNELEIPNFADNTDKRCYYCKSELFKISFEQAASLGFETVVDGSNADDAMDYRPGKAAAVELGVRSPLLDVGLTKDEIRFLSRELGLPTWNKPSAACLSSRFPYGTAITEERLGKVGKAEDLLRSLGFYQFRVRYHNDVARIEADLISMRSFLDEAVREKVVDGFKKIGFIYVTLDLQGFRSGSMNEALKAKGG